MNFDNVKLPLQANRFKILEHVVGESSDPYAIFKIYNRRKSDITSNKERNQLKGVEVHAVSYNEEIKLPRIIGIQCLM